MDVHESPLRGVEYLQHPLKLMEIACAQHFSRGWLRETGTPWHCKKTASGGRLWGKENDLKSRYIALLYKSLLKQQGAFVLWVAVLLKTRLPSGLALKGREIKQAERCLPAVASAGLSIPCTASLHSIASTATSGLSAEQLSAKYFRRCWRYFKLEVYLPTSNWPESKGEADYIL